jgi:glycosyltransferase involved in cell wall biosynthesis
MKAISSVDIVLPVYNEEHCLAQSARQVLKYLSSNVSWAWRIVIVDNASTDRTPAIGRELASQVPQIEMVRLERKGRGYALRHAFESSRADAVMYMDIDLSTSLTHLSEIVDLLQAGHDLAVGSRLAATSQVERSIKRELISRAYNVIVTIMFGRVCGDFQCGFKAFRRSTVQKLLPLVKDNGYFFDTEIILTASRTGCRIIDLPVRWVEDPDSRVNLLPTILADLAGLIRLRWEFLTNKMYRSRGA